MTPIQRHGRIRVTIPGRAQDSYAELYLPIQEVISGIHDLTESGAKPIEIDNFYTNGDGVIVTLQRVSKVEKT